MNERANIKDGESDEEKKYCLNCHRKTGSIKKFPDGSSVSIYVDASLFDKSVHRTLKCTSCHKEFSDKRHPNRGFRNRLQYEIKESHICLDCHSKETIKAVPIHESLFKKEAAGKAVICTNCHKAHEVGHVKAGSIATSEEKYCLTCHAKNDRMFFKNKQSKSIHVNSMEIRNSSHKNIGCSDCHVGYSAEEHQRRIFRSEREYRLSSSAICRRCHFDKYSKVSESIHHSMLSIGKQNAPTCVDCHGGHAVSSLGNDRLSVVQKCQACHGNIYDVYARSVHGSALFNENNRDVPTCIDCHSSHSIKDPFSPDFHDYIPEMCSSCHSNQAVVGKYGLSTDVVKTYLSDFHGVTLSLYRKDAQRRYRPIRPIAVCTDCHGTHDIAGVMGADKNVVKKNLLKRCQSCHNNASENFPDAWLSHYKPNIKTATMVFIVEQFYKIMLPLMVAGVLFQVILDIWRYFLNR